MTNEAALAALLALPLVEPPCVYEPIHQGSLVAGDPDLADAAGSLIARSLDDGTVASFSVLLVRVAVGGFASIDPVGCVDAVDLSGLGVLEVVIPS
ncbi:MAG: hypothetical protein AAB367_04690, partial [Patescibacteria group bacterium]